MFEIIYSPIINTALLVCMWVLVFINKDFLFSNSKKGGTNYFVFWLFVTIFAIFYCPYGGDTYNGNLDLIEYAKYGSKGHYEDLYYIPINFLPNNYQLWRGCIWGLASLFVVKSYKRLNCSSQYATVIFLLVTLVQCFYYLRNSLAFSTLFLSIIIFFSNHNRLKLKTLLIAGCLIVFSFFAHNSMPVYFLLAIFAILLPFNKFTFIISIVLFPFIRNIVSDLALDFLSQNFISEGTYELGIGYLSRENTFAPNLSGYLFLLFTILPFIFILIHAIIYMKKDEENYKTKKILLILTYEIIYVAFCFLGTASNHLFLRFWNTCTFPMALVIPSYLITRKKERINVLFICAITLYYILKIISSF